VGGTNDDGTRPSGGPTPAKGTRRPPLEGIRVIDMGQIYNGPYCSFLMAMAGADVVKVEPPGGENMRRRTVVGGAALPFAMLNSTSASPR
jgi:crotonobetainyl-CoA:carnitine CoA-transferase CaiB-like acyl-CoA transferase